MAGFSVKDDINWFDNFWLKTLMISMLLALFPEHHLHYTRLFLYTEIWAFGY